MHLAVAGNIGSGKTTLTGLLSKHYKYEAHFEDVENNPFIMICNVGHSTFRCIF